MIAKIYNPAKSVMQSGKAKTKNWLLEFEHDGSRAIDPVMEWTSSSDMNQEISIKFSSKKAAIKFAKANNLDYEVYEPQKRNITIQSYADNFK